MTNLPTLASLWGTKYEGRTIEAWENAYFKSYYHDKVSLNGEWVDAEYMMQRTHAQFSKEPGFCLQDVRSNVFRLGRTKVPDEHNYTEIKVKQKESGKVETVYITPDMYRDAFWPGVACQFKVLEWGQIEAQTKADSSIEWMLVCHFHNLDLLRNNKQHQEELNKEKETKRIEMQSCRSN